VSTRIAPKHVVPPVCRHEKESVMHLVCLKRNFKIQLLYKAEQLTISLVSVEMATREAEPMERMGATCKTMSVHMRRLLLLCCCHMYRWHTDEADKPDTNLHFSTLPSHRRTPRHSTPPPPRSRRLLLEHRSVSTIAKNALNLQKQQTLRNASGSWVRTWSWRTSGACTNEESVLL